MQRRRFVSAAAGVATGLLAGCLSDSHGGTDGSVSGQSGDSPPPDALRRVEVAEVTGVPDDLPLEVELAARQPWVTSERRAVVRLSMTNTGSTAREYQAAIYETLSRRHGSSGLAVYHEKAADGPPADSSPPCWTTDQPSKEELSWITEPPATYEIEPGASRTFDLIVADDPTAEGCFPPGSYRFETDRIVARTRFTWGFTLQVTDVSSEAAGPADGSS